MKLVELGPLSRINAFLDHVNVGDSVVCGNLEAYSCKLSGLDKRLSQSLDREIEVGAPSATSPVGPLTESSSRKTLVFLILTLNQCFPDYDFSLLRAHHFRKEESVQDIEALVDSHLLEVSKVWEQNPAYGKVHFLDALWNAIDEACELPSCDVYSYRMDRKGEDPFSDEGSIWAFNFFFYNRRLKRIVFLSCRSLSKSKAAEADALSTPEPEVSLQTYETRDTKTSKDDGDSESEIVGGMDDV